MDTIIEFFNNDGKTDYCRGKKYRDFIDYAFINSDYFMLVYVNYYARGYSFKQKMYRKLLLPYEVKTRTNPSWPGTLWTISKDSTYRIVFYKNTKKSKKILKIVSSISSWSRPEMPEDLAFFKGNTCWFYSVGHEKIAAFINPSEDDLDFLESKGLAERKNIVAYDSSNYSLYDEELEKYEV